MFILWKCLVSLKRGGQVNLKKNHCLFKPSFPCGTLRLGTLESSRHIHHMPEFQLCPSDIFDAVLDYPCGKRSCHIVGRSTYFFHHETLDVALDEVGAETSTRTQDKINGPAVCFWLGMGRQVFRAQIRYRCQTFLGPLRASGYSTRVPNSAVSWVQLLHQRRPKSWEGDLII